MFDSAPETPAPGPVLEVILCLSASYFTEAPPKKDEGLRKEQSEERVVNMNGSLNTECEKCGMKFETISELRMHLEDVHGELQRKRKIVRQKPKKKR